MDKTLVTVGLALLGAWFVFGRSSVRPYMAPTSVPTTASRPPLTYGVPVSIPQTHNGGAPGWASDALGVAAVAGAAAGVIGQVSDLIDGWF